MSCFSEIVCLVGHQTWLCSITSRGCNSSIQKVHESRKTRSKWKVKKLHSVWPLIQAAAEPRREKSTMLLFIDRSSSFYFKLPITIISFSSIFNKQNSIRQKEKQKIYLSALLLHLILFSFYVQLVTNLFQYSKQKIYKFYSNTNYNCFSVDVNK